MKQEELNEFSQKQIEDNKNRIKGFFEFQEKKKEQEAKDFKIEKQEVNAKMKKERIEKERKKAEDED